MKEFAEEYDIGVVASTQRIVHSPKIHTFGSVIYEKKSNTFYEESPYENIEVVDRIGSGDAYISGVLYRVLSADGSCLKALQREQSKAQYQGICRRLYTAKSRLL